MALCLHTGGINAKDEGFAMALTDLDGRFRIERQMDLLSLLRLQAFALYGLNEPRRRAMEQDFRRRYGL